MKRVHLIHFLLLATISVLAGCGKKANTFAPPPPPQVDARPPLIQDTTVYVEFPGRTQAFALAEIRARVQGFLMPATTGQGPFEFQPGQMVKQDQVLFHIEPDQYDAAVATANGNVEKAKVDWEIATANHIRRKNAGRGVSVIEVETAEAEMKAAEAVVKVEQASLKRAELDLSYAEITSPIAGRVSRSLVDVGNLVGTAEPTLLTTVVQDDRIYVNFEASERQYLRYAARYLTDEARRTGEKLELKLILSTGTEHPFTGQMDFVDNAVNPESGTIKLRAIFENRDRILKDGMFVRVGVPELIEDAVLVPRSAVQRDLQGSFVLLAGEGDQVERRLVDPSAFVSGELRILRPYDEAKATGVKPGDRVIVSNLQRARPGIQVAPNELPPPESGAGDLSSMPDDAEPIAPENGEEN